MVTIQQVELGVLGPLQVRRFGLPVVIPGAKPRAVLTMLGLSGGSVVAADTLVELLWGDTPPRTAAKALQTHISALRRALGDGFVLTQGTGWSVNAPEIDATRYRTAAALGRNAMGTGNTSEAVARFDEALSLWRGTPELGESRRATSEKTRWTEDHAALVEGRAEALLATGRAAEIIGELEAAIADAPLRERRWGHVMLALYRAGRQGEALAAYQRARTLLADELGVDPGPELRRLEAAIVAQDGSLELTAAQHHSAVTRTVTFLLTDIEGSTAAWERDADAMAAALARHDETVEQVVTSRGGRLVKTRGEGDATFSVFDRPSAAAAAAIELQEAIRHEPWQLAEPLRIRVALHTGEVEFRDGDYFGRAVNRAARLRSLAAGGQTLCSGATAELVIDTLADDVVLADLGTRQLKNLVRPERVFELRLEMADENHAHSAAVIERPAIPTVLIGNGPFVGRGGELESLATAWRSTLSAGAGATLIAGEPGVGKTRLAGEWSRRAYDEGAVVLYGRCDEDLAAPYQPFSEALRALVPCLGADRLRGLRGVESLLALVSNLAEELPELAVPSRADPDTERYALFDAVVGLLANASASAPVIVILDDLHWAAKPTLLLLRHLLRFGEHARVQIVGTYRSTDLDRSHPLAAMLADLNRDGTAARLQLGGLDSDDVTAYVAAVGYDDEELARALASVTGGNPFFLIEALRHVDESGGRWDPSTLPQGVREAVSRRLSRLSVETNKALGAAAVVGSRFPIDLVERVMEQDLVDAFDEARMAGIVIEEPGGRYRFNHALVRQSLLAELASVRRMRLHQRIAVALESEFGSRDDTLAELAYHYFECAWAGNAVKAVDYCRRAADQAMVRLAYEGAADLYDKALHALEELDDDLPDRDELHGELLIARCEALLAAGDVASAAEAVHQLRRVAGESGRIAAWGTCFDGELTALTDPERLDEIESAVSAAAETLARLGDAAGEAKAHTVRAACLGRLGRIGDCEAALDQALTAARRARDHRRVNAVLANAPLAALWGPSPVPRAGGRCLDVVRLLRITTGSPVVEATSTRCQGVLDAFRGRAGSGRQLVESARRSVVELGMRHALVEVEQFAGIIELVADDAAAAERHLRKAYNGFRRMRLDADTAETAALLARACLALDSLDDADALCAESERLCGHALKASIAWRTVRAQLLARNGTHGEARRVAEEAVAIAQRTDALVDHGDACLALASVLGMAGDAAAARAAAEKAVELYTLKGAVALVETARRLVELEPPTKLSGEPAAADIDNTCVRVIRKLDETIAHDGWGTAERLLAPSVQVESRRKIVGSPRRALSPSEWHDEARRFRDAGVTRIRRTVLAARGEALALFRTSLGTADESPGAAEDQLLHLMGLDADGRVALHMSFDVEDRDAAIAELDARYLAGEAARLAHNRASEVYQRLWACIYARDWDAAYDVFSDDVVTDDRRRVVNAGIEPGRDAQLANLRCLADIGAAASLRVIAVRGQRIALLRIRTSNTDLSYGEFDSEMLVIVGIDSAERISAGALFDVEDLQAAFAELDARYSVGEAAPKASTWSVVAASVESFNRGDFAAATANWTSVDHRRVAAFGSGDMAAYMRAAWDQTPGTTTYIEAVHRLGDGAAVVEQVTEGTSQDGFTAQWRVVCLICVDGGRISRFELFDESDVAAAVACFDELSRPSSRLQNTAGRTSERLARCFAAQDWNALSDILVSDFKLDDRRRVVGAGIRHGRDAEVDDLRAFTAVGLTNVLYTVLATRGDRLMLARTSMWGGDSQTHDLHSDLLTIAEVGAEGRMTAAVLFDRDDLGGAISELDARYLLGEAAPNARTWSVVAAFGPGEMANSTRAAWEQTPSATTYIEAVHRLGDGAAVVEQVTEGTSQDGFTAQWRVVCLICVDGGRISRFELFDESDLDAALARCDEIAGPTERLENAASRAGDRLATAFAASDWESVERMLDKDFVTDDRRRVVNAGVRHGRGAGINDLRTTADIGFEMMSWSVTATRGEHLALTRARYGRVDEHPEAFDNDAFSDEVLHIIEINDDGSIVSITIFDEDDLDSALAAMDARHEAAPPRSTQW